MILFTGIFGIRIKIATTSPFYFFPNNILICFLKALSALGLILLSMENLQDFITQVII